MTKKSPKYSAPTIIRKEVDFEEKPFYYIETRSPLTTREQLKRGPGANLTHYRYRVGAPREVYRNGRNQWVQPVSEAEEIAGYDDQTCIIVAGTEITAAELKEMAKEMAERRLKKTKERWEQRATPDETVAALKELAAMRLAAGRGRRQFYVPRRKFVALDRLSPDVVDAMAKVAKER